MFGFTYPICSNLYYCGFRLGALLSCHEDYCELTFIAINSSVFPANYTKIFYNKDVRLLIDVDIGNVEYQTITIYYLIIRTINESFRLPLWGSLQSEDTPYPIIVYTDGIVYECSDVKQCPFNNPIACTLYEFFRHIWSAIYNMLPFEVKQFFTIVFTLLSVVSNVLVLLTPQLLIMIATIIPLAFTFMLIHALLHGVDHLIKFINTLYEFVSSVVEWIMKLINTLKP